jgi:hypothetical protein
MLESLFFVNVQQVVTQFKLDPKYRALLMSTRHGANGLNLIEATHVLMVEPLLNNGADAQAVNRVHRIGQTKPTFVHRFVVHETVEEKVWSFAHSTARKSSLDDVGEIAAGGKKVYIFVQSWHANSIFMSMTLYVCNRQKEEWKII